MKQKTAPIYLAIVALVLALGFASIGAVAKNSNANSGKAEKNKSEKAVNLKDFEKPDKSKGQTNAQLHSGKTEKVKLDLKKAAKNEKMAGNTEVSEQIEEVAEEQEAIQEDTTEAIAEVEGEGKVKKFILGPDYKNLGQLRSNLVHNRNQIRKLTKALGGVVTEEQQLLIQQQLEVLMQERERIKTVITTNEEGFSLLGWVSRFLFDYEETPINEQEEEELTEEVETAIEEAESGDVEDGTESESTEEDGSAGEEPISDGTEESAI